MPEALAPVDIGDVLPAVTLKNEKDEDVQVADLAAERGVVLFLVPKADTRESWPHAFSSCSKTDHGRPRLLLPLLSFDLVCSFDLRIMGSRMHDPGLWVPGHLPRVLRSGL